MNQLFANTKLAMSVHTVETRIVSQPEPEETDRRYRLLVQLVRSDKPTYWTAHCMKCKAPLVEVLNAEIESITDLVSMEDVSNVGIGLRCDGPYCRYWWYFKLNGSESHGSK